MSKRYKKIKLTSDGKVLLVYEQQSGPAWDEYSVCCSDAPRTDFHLALNALAAHVVEMCELPDGDELRITVKGVSFSYGGSEEVMGATITATRRLDNSTVPLNLNTPHKAEEFYGETGDERQLLTDDCAAALYRLCDEADAYLDGQRQQMSLPLDTPAADEEIEIGINGGELVRTTLNKLFKALDITEKLAAMSTKELLGLRTHATLKGESKFAEIIEAELLRRGERVAA